ncbi:BREX-1 system adenine-specific DNA-methyltransferase PglX [Rathayibacter sp. Leaf248]|uniref:BREX-1 system adenine-specific DNA-methyltransferase PglX n=1 Tax=Rathayibacter sp. Leaf248 TaxID=2876555 RepID=UPI001E5F3175|nr:BREX-1 system adenine-specific DNA-methyltransferase PglX [Rathayibacter sp. Leaf248]
MDTKDLENFAKAARRELISAVSAQASAVLAPGSVARTERAETVRRLETEIAVHGHEHVIDKVAYTWFNRLIALRFMDAKGYMGAGIVSPAQGQPHGQPEILADAKRGDIDADVVTSSTTRGAILGLLDGTRRSTDAEGEAYALLLTEHCRYWHKSMPFMFEREGDYTELLVPAGLLADGGIVARTRKVLTEEVCDDVEVIGWLYQFYISERKDEVFAGFKQNKKAGADEIPAATQLFTPHWIVRYLVENSVGRLWMLNRPASRLVDRMGYYIAPADKEIDFLKLSGPEELTVIDPACGSGHMLTYAFDLLYAIYDEEGYAPSEIPSLILTHNIHGTEIDPRAGALAAFALTMKARAKDRRFFTRATEPKICVIEPIRLRDDEVQVISAEQGGSSTGGAFWTQFEHADTLGALIQPDAWQVTNARTALERVNVANDILYAQAVERAWKLVKQGEALSTQYAAFVANPPYMGRGNMGARLIEFVDAHYSDSAGGLDASFISRAGSMTLRGGISALVTMQSWMYLSSFEQFRRRILGTRSISTLCHLGTGVFDSLGGEVVAVVATVFRQATSAASGVYLRLVDIADRDSELRTMIDDPGHPMRYHRKSADFIDAHRAILAYFADAALSDFLAGTALRNYVEAGVGSQTGENSKYVRYWFEVSQADLNLDGRDGVDTAKWTPSTKGGEFRRWYDPTLSVMDWRGDGEVLKRESKGAVIRNSRIYFRPHLSWSKVGTKIPSFRFGDDRLVHNDASCFVVADGADIDSISSYLNSRTIASLVKEFNPTLNLRPSSFLDFPFVEIDPSQGRLCRELSKRDWDRDELSLDFASPVLIPSRAKALSATVSDTLSLNSRMTEEFIELENQIERAVTAAAGLANPIRIPQEEHSLFANPAYRYGAGKSAEEYDRLSAADLARDLLSYAVGCMFGRYSLDEPGLILADQGSTLQDYLAKVPAPTFTPDTDNVIPFVDDGWFEDDIVERFRQFLRASFSAEHFEENLRFVEESLGVTTLRDYFITKSGKSKFYDDHVQRYKQRPIYWMFSSPKGSFNALIYLHRYTPSTASTVLNEYLREYEAKLTVALQQAEMAAVGGGSVKNQKEADRLRKVLAELRDYEHDVLYPLATKQIAIDLDDGVKVNYPKLRPAVKKIAALEASDG